MTRVAVGLATWCAGAATLKADTANAAKRAKRMAAMLRILFDGFRLGGRGGLGGSVARATTQLGSVKKTSFILTFVIQVLNMPKLDVKMKLLLLTTP